MTDEAKILALPGRLDLQTAKAMKASLVDARGQAVTINAAAVEWVGGLGAQILVAAQTTWSEDGQPFAIAEPSAAFTEGLRRLGFRPDLNPLEEC